MSLAILFSALLANGLKNAKDGEFEYIKDDNTLKIFRLIMPLSVVFSLFVGLYLPSNGVMGEIPSDFGWAQLKNQSITNTAIPSLWEYLGAALFVFGLTLRWVAIISLKRAFTVKVTILKNHQLKSDGVYRWVRHPSYTGMYIYALGLGFALHNILSVFILLWGVWYTTHKRIPIEESVLEEHFGDSYRNYKAKTWKLFPLIY
jgi:protein-S-isoprenylcysteine O-methyltransferase Ste14